VHGSLWTATTEVAPAIVELSQPTPAATRKVSKSTFVMNVVAEATAAAAERKKEEPDNASLSHIGPEYSCEH
jgi:hypothetical protein